MKPNVYIWKYRTVNPDGFLNYFVGSANLQFIDKIRLSDALMDIPLYDERFEKAGEVLEFQASDFELKLSLLAESLSDCGDTINEFLLPQDARNNLFVCVVEFGNYFDPLAKRIIGKIELKSIATNYTVTQNRYDISFKCTGLLKELADYLNRKTLPQINSTTYLDDYLTDHLLNITGTDYYSASQNLRLANKIGFRPVLIREMYNDIIIRNKMNGCWDSFKEILRGLGFMFRFGASGYPDFYSKAYPPVYLDCYWRTEGTLRTIEKITEIEKYSDLNAYKNYLLVLYRSGVLGHGNEYAGMLKDSNGNTWIADNYAGSVFEEITINDSDIVTTVVANQTPPQIWKGNATVIELPTYATVYQVSIEQNNQYIGAKESLSGCFCNYYLPHIDPVHQSFKLEVFGIKLLLQKTIEIEYDYLVVGVKKMLENDIVFNNMTNLKVSDKISLNNTNQFWLKAVTQINLKEEKAKLQWIES